MAIIKDYRGEWDVASVKVNFSNGDQRIYSGCKPLIVPNNYKYNPYPKKGDLINIEGRTYRVLKVNGTIAELLSPYDATRKPDCRTDGSNIYENSKMDIYCNETFYNTLSDNIKTAIVEKQITQDLWASDTSVPASYDAKYAAVCTYRGLPSNYDLFLINKNYGNTISRKCYSLFIKDIVEYLNTTPEMTHNDTTLTYKNLYIMLVNNVDGFEYGGNSMFYSGNGNEDIWFVGFSTYGEIDKLDLSSYTAMIQPAFQIDLSKIDWSIV